ncbi:acetyltransferase [Paenibacillus sp. KS-LC4]|uniref:acetyltransferase n=1 Tax=Paenibacillus sp. KS-LC4 TaxID=2979727 RepID=UPI0030D1A58A
MNAVSANPYRTVVVGAGGHAKVVVDILRTSQAYKVIGCIGREPGGQVLNVPVLGDDTMLPLLLEQGVRHAFIAIGDNAARLRLARHVQSLGFELINAISPLAYIAPSASLGCGIAVMPGGIIQPDAKIGSLTIINTAASVDHDCIIGEACHLAPGSTLSGGVTVGDGSFLGTGTVVIDGIRIGAGCMIGAGAAVIRNIPDQTLAAGVPATVKRHLNQERT